MHVCQKPDENLFLGQLRSADGGIHTITSEVYSETLKECVGLSRKKGVLNVDIWCNVAP
jgi:hypothetical protein